MSDARPDIIPIFPLSGALLLPGGMLPLNIFEPRYLAMTEDALQGNRLIGIIQPRKEKMSCGSACVHEIGCAGEISEHEYTPDGRIIISLQGLWRYKVLEELPPLRGYRRVRVQWLDESLADGPADSRIDRARLLPALRNYLHQRGLACQWHKLECCPDSKLVTVLSMVCPFAPAEQQALLEAPNTKTRGELLTALIELSGTSDKIRPH